MARMPKRKPFFLVLMLVTAATFSVGTWSQIMCVSWSQGPFTGRLYTFACLQIPGGATGCEPGCCCIINCSEGGWCDLGLLQGCVEDPAICILGAQFVCAGTHQCI